MQYIYMTLKTSVYIKKKNNFMYVTTSSSNIFKKNNYILRRQKLAALTSSAWLAHHSPHDEGHFSLISLQLLGRGAEYEQVQSLGFV